MTEPFAPRLVENRPADPEPSGSGLGASDDMIRAFYWTRRPRTLPEQIADDVSRRILGGEFQPGQRVGEVELVEDDGRRGVATHLHTGGRGGKAGVAER